VTVTRNEHSANYDHVIASHDACEKRHSFEGGRDNTFNLAQIRPTCSCTMPLPTDPIALNITFRNETMADPLLRYPVELEEQDNMTMFSLGDGDDTTKVSPIR
jgi:hypothetical protein